MANDSYPVVPSLALERALATSATAAAFQSLAPQTAAPEPYGAGAGTDGVWDAGQGGAMAPNRAFLLPLCAGPPGAQFTLRLYGWRATLGGENERVWLPVLLIELACTAGDLPGPSPAQPGPLSPRRLSNAENLCDGLAATLGGPGPTGEVLSAGPGGGVASAALVELRGCQKLQFDFQQADAVAMNCLWARV